MPTAGSAEADLPDSIGRLSGFMGNSGVNLRAYIYMRMLGREGMVRVAEFATLNANYLLRRLTEAGYEAAYPTRRASHEFIITLRQENRRYQVTAMDVAKRLLDFGVHAPTTYFPAAGARVPADRADRDRKQGGARQFLRRDDPNSAGNGTRARETADPHRIQCRSGGWTTCGR